MPKMETTVAKEGVETQSWEHFPFFALCCSAMHPVWAGHEPFCSSVIHTDATRWNSCLTRPPFSLFPLPTHLSLSDTRRGWQSQE